MATVFPGDLDDSYTTKVDNVDDVMAADINDLQLAITAIETKVGIDSSIVTTSHDYKHFPADTTMVFGDNAAPQGWTRKADWTDGAMFVYSAAGGLASGGAVSPFAVHLHSTPAVGISIAQMPAHNHAGSTAAADGAHTHDTGANSGTLGSNPSWVTNGDPDPIDTEAADPATHTHTVTVTSQGSGSTHAHGNTGNSSVPYYQELMAAVKD